MRRLLQPLQVLTLACLFACFFVFAGCGKSGSDATIIAPLGDKPTSRTPSLEEERPAVNAKINALSQALLAKDIEKAALLVSPAKRAERRKRFQAYQDKMPLLGERLRTATLAGLAGGYTQNGNRVGFLTGEDSLGTFEISIVQIDGEWFFEDL